MVVRCFEFSKLEIFGYRPLLLSDFLLLYIIVQHFAKVGQSAVEL